MTTSDALNALAIFVLVLGSFALGYILASTRAYKRGRDEQWVENFLASEKREKSRREPNGRFKSKTK
jgi:hypothetical protein